MIAERRGMWIHWHDATRGSKACATTAAGPEHIGGGATNRRAQPACSRPPATFRVAASLRFGGAASSEVLQRHARAFFFFGPGDLVAAPVLVDAPGECRLRERNQEAFVVVPCTGIPLAWCRRMIANNRLGFSIIRAICTSSIHRQPLGATRRLPIQPMNLFQAWQLCCTVTD